MFLPYLHIVFYTISSHWGTWVFQYSSKWLNTYYICSTQACFERVTISIFKSLFCLVASLLWRIEIFRIVLSPRKAYNIYMPLSDQVPIQLYAKAKLPRVIFISETWAHFFIFSRPHTSCENLSSVQEELWLDHWLLN